MSDAFRQKRQSVRALPSRPTKRRLLERIKKDGLVGVCLTEDGRYQVRLPEDPDPAGGAWLSLTPDRLLIVDDDSAIVRIAGEEVPMTRAEAERVAAFVRATMRRRSRRTRIG